MFKLRPYQKELLTDVIDKLEHSNVKLCLQLITGGGKCLGAGTPVLMYDGTIKKVEDVVVNDVLMGPDSKPRKVLSTCKGKEQLYKVTPVKGDPYVVNESHILSLKMTNYKGCLKVLGKKVYSGDIINISVKDYLESSKSFKHCAKGWRVGVDFDNEQPLPHDPYFIGLWLGDGSSLGSNITTGDQEVKDWLKQYAETLGGKVKFVYNSENSEVVHLQGSYKTGRSGTVFNNKLKECDLIQNKHIPHIYKTASKDNRLRLLAGILDSDGYYDGKNFSITFKNETLLDDVVFLARSLGFSAYKRVVEKTCTNTGKKGVYYACCINGHLDTIPTQVERRKAKPRGQVKNVLVTGIKVEPLDVGDYYGFEIDGDRLFLLGDFTVTHNTVIFASVAKHFFDKGARVLVLAHREELIQQAHDKLEKILEQPIGVIKAGIPETPALPVQVASVQSLVRRLERHDEFDLIIVDECHHVVSNSYKKILTYYDSAKVLGVTATPLRLDGKGLNEIFDELLCGPDCSYLIRNKYLCSFRAYAQTPMNTSNVKTIAGDYSVNDLARENNAVNLAGDLIKSYRERGKDGKCIVFAVNVEHSKTIAEEYNKAGIPSAHLDGKSPTVERQETLRKFREGEIRVLSNVGLFDEGFDLPSAQVVQIARPTKSVTKHFQILGRVLRRDGNKVAILIDHTRNIETHGLPTTPQEWTLNGLKKQQRERKRVVNKKDGSISETIILTEQEVKLKRLRDVSWKKQQLLKKIGKTFKSLEEFEKDVENKVRKLITLKEQRDYKPGWLYYAIKKDAIVLTQNLWFDLAEYLGYKDGWAIMKYKEQEMVQADIPFESERKLIRHTNLKVKRQYTKVLLEDTKTGKVLGVVENPDKLVETINSMFPA